MFFDGGKLLSFVMCVLLIVCIKPIETINNNRWSYTDKLNAFIFVRRLEFPKFNYILKVTKVHPSSPTRGLRILVSKLGI